MEDSDEVLGALPELDFAIRIDFMDNIGKHKDKSGLTAPFSSQNQHDKGEIRFFIILSPAFGTLNLYILRAIGVFEGFKDRESVYAFTIQFARFFQEGNEGGIDILLKGVNDVWIFLIPDFRGFADIIGHV